MNHPILRGAAALLVLSLACSTAAAQSLISQYGEVIMAVGSDVPGLPGVTINSTSNFDIPSIDQDGAVLFRARMVGGTVSATDDRAYFLGRTNGDLAMVLRSGDQAPGLATGILMRTATGNGPTGSPRISPFSKFLFFQSALYDGGVTVTTANDTALFWGPVGGILALAREGDPVNIPGVTAGYTFGSQAFSSQNNLINGSGQALFSTQLIGAPADQDAIMVAGTPGNLSKVFQEGDLMGTAVVIPVSGTTTMSFVNQMNEVSQVLHEVRFSTTVGSATTADDRALAVWTPGLGDLLVAREGQQAPGLAAGVLFATPSLGWTVDTGAAVFTKSGKTAINAALDQGGVTAGVDDRAIYYGGTAGLSLVVRRNDVVAGLTNDIRWGVFNNSSLTCNDLGQVAAVTSFQDGTVPGAVTAANDSCIALGTAGNMAPLAVEGDPVPNVPGFTFGQFSGGTNSPYLNEQGHVVFQATITDGASSPSVLFGYDAAHGLRIMLDPADTFTTPLGTAAWTGFGALQFNSGDSGASHFNNSGDWVARVGLASPQTAAIVRGHLGALPTKPASLSAVTGGTQTFGVDVGPSNGSAIYVILGTQSGTRPGFPSPLGPQTIQLNFDFYTQLSLDLANSPFYTNTLWFTDAMGKSLLPASFNLPAGATALQGFTLHHSVTTLDFSTLASTFTSEPASVVIY